jgi:hypothetical protein
MDNTKVTDSTKVMDTTEDINNTREIEFSFSEIIYFYIDIYSNVCIDIIDCFS